MNLKDLFLISTYCFAYIHAHNTLLARGSNRLKNCNQKAPWIGVLRVMSARLNGPEGLTGIILIAERVAIGNAHEIAQINLKTIRKTAIVQFYRRSSILQMNVTGYILHPEYSKPRINTIAIVNLDPDMTYGRKYWHPIVWPNEAFHANRTIFAIGFVEKKRTLTQQVRRMSIVEYSSCKTFYVKEGMDFDTIWPTYTLCMKDVKDKGVCVYDSGMALISHIEGKWTLLGISILGPGCSLPARFIDLFPYLDWIKSHAALDQKTMTIDSKTTLTKYNSNLRRRLGDFQWDLPWEPFHDRDRLIFNPLTDRSVEMYFLEKGHTIYTSGVLFKDKQFNPHLRCPPDIKLEYREKGFIENDPRTLGMYYFALSYYDLKYNNIKCVRLKLISLWASLMLAERHIGFGIDSIDEYIFKEPFVYKNLSGIQRKHKVLYLKDNYEKYNYQDVLSVWMKLKFFGKVVIDLEFYAHPKSNPYQYQWNKYKHWWSDSQYQRNIGKSRFTTLRPILPMHPKRKKPILREWKNGSFLTDYFSRKTKTKQSPLLTTTETSVIPKKVPHMNHIDVWIENGRFYD